MVARKVSEPPAVQEIVNRDRAYLRGLGLSGWYDEIERLAWLLKLNPLDKEVWGSVLGGDFDNFIPAIVQYPTVEILDHVKEGYKVPALGLPALLVQLNAPDAAILKEVKAKLKVARLKYPSRAKMPGRKALNGQFDEHKFAQWRGYKICVLAELLAWRAGLSEPERRKISNSTLGKWLDFAEPDKKIHLAIEVLAEAMASLREMHAQLNPE